MGTTGFLEAGSGDQARAAGPVASDEILAEYRFGLRLARAGDMAAARFALQRVADSADPELSPAAALDLGSVYKATGDIGPARRAYEAAASSGHPEAAPLAARD
nr:hypothetical protein [Actinomycetota bacterium]